MTLKMARKGENSGIVAVDTTWKPFEILSKPYYWRANINCGGSRFIRLPPSK